MRVGIYNRWLATLGGGEKYSLAVAEYLARRHSVSVITHQPVSKTLAMQRLNLDLSRVEFVAVPDRPTVDLSSLTTQYDFFINASFQDVFPSLAPQSALLIYFPTPLAVERTKRLYRRVGLFLKRLLMVPTFTGVLQTQTVPGSQLRSFGAELRIRLPPSRRSYSISFDLASRDQVRHHATISLDSDRIAAVHLPVEPSFITYKTRVPPIQRAFHEITVRLDDEASVDASPIKLVMTRFQIAHPRYRLYQLLFEYWLKDWGLRLHRTPTPATLILECVDSYRDIWAISQFTRKWIRNYWNRSSALLFPPVDVENFVPSKKLNQILTVGRFFSGSHNKKHDKLIAAFKEMVDGGLEGWHFHLAGGTRPGKVHEEYLEQLFRDVCGYPITIHPDISFGDLIKLYGESAIYWHASGLGEDEYREPIKFEHFGITTVEAMASGCVPVVIGKGGQPEIVKHGQNGFLWNTIAELKKLTLQLIEDDSWRTLLADAAIRDSRFYDKAHFEARLGELLSGMGID